MAEEGTMPKQSLVEVSLGEVKWGLDRQLVSVDPDGQMVITLRTTKYNNITV